MKKMFFALALMFVAMTASAQIYVGGSLGYWHSKTEDTSVLGSPVSTTNSFTFAPEVGYSLNDRWAVAASLNYNYSNVAMTVGPLTTKIPTHTFSINPYARFTFYKGDMLSLFVDGGVGYGFTKVDNGDAQSMFNVGIRPGLALNVSDNFSLVAHYGFLGYEHNAATSTNAFGLNIDGSTITLGAYYSF